MTDGTLRPADLPLLAGLARISLAVARRKLAAAATDVSEPAAAKPARSRRVA